MSSLSIAATSSQPPPQISPSKKTPPIMRIPTEIANAIIREVIGHNKIRVDGTLLKPLLWEADWESGVTSWATSPAPNLMHVCRAWREIVFQLPLWQELTVRLGHHGKGKVSPSKRGKTDFLDFCMRLAGEKELKLTLDICAGDQDNEDTQVDCDALTYLIRTKPRWSSFFYISTLITLPRFLIKVLDHVGDRAYEWSRFGIELRGVQVEETLVWMPRVVQRVEEMLNLTDLTMDLGEVLCDGGDDEVWDWRDAIPSSVVSGLSSRVRILDLRCEPAVAWKVIGWFPELLMVRLRLWFDEPERSESFEARGYADTPLQLNIEQFSVVMQKECQFGPGYGRLFDSLSFPKLRDFNVTWPRKVGRDWPLESAQADLVACVQAFVSRCTERRLNGRVYLWRPKGPQAELEFFEEKGLVANAFWGYPPWEIEEYREAGEGYYLYF
ncbi:hypothetical protein V5O48_015313 [Marasmius crinis-equi]|uniref:F-box domain-containing protein n=1 Tax=Marasmius crinis-equi TaxID=585013 RepID=A0ABR3EUW2_9AGAR